MKTVTITEGTFNTGWREHEVPYELHGFVITDGNLCYHHNVEVKLTTYSQDVQLYIILVKNAEGLCDVVDWLRRKKIFHLLTPILCLDLAQNWFSVKIEINRKEYMEISKEVLTDRSYSKYKCN